MAKPDGDDNGFINLIRYPRSESSALKSSPNRQKTERSYEVKRECDGGDVLSHRLYPT